MRLLFILLPFSLALAAAWPAQLAAADAVWIKAASPTANDAKWTGQIEDLTGAELALRVTDNLVRRFPSESVVKIETSHTDEQLQGDAHLAAGEYDEALRAYEIALKKETRPWMRREILAQIVWCQKGKNDVALAGDYLIVLYEQDPTTRHLDATPLAWGAATDVRSVERKAQQWLDRDDSPLARLLGASYLLATQQRGRAVDELGRLAAGRDGQLAALARAQLWRTQLVTARPQDILAWQQAVEAMPEGLRAGPYFVLGQALARQRQYEQAALVFLRVPTLYARDRHLAAAALDEAARSLKSIGRNDEAARIEHRRDQLTSGGG